MESVRLGIQDVLFISVIQFGQMLFSAAVMAYCDWPLFLVVVAMAPILWGINRHFRVRLSRYSAPLPKASAGSRPPWRSPSTGFG